jgi:ribosome-binding factor A
LFKRSEKVAEAVQKLVSQLIINGLKDPRIGFVTITGVKVTNDMGLATVFFTVVGTDQEKKGTEAGLNSARGFIRKEMGKQLRLRNTPDIVFKYDTSIEHGSHIEALFKEISSQEGGDDSEHSS